MKSSANKREGTAAQWRQRIVDQAGSGQSAAAFCRERGLAKATFYWWKTRLSKARSVVATRSVSEVPFIDLGSVNDMPTAVPASVTAPAMDIRLDLGGGMVLTITRR